HPWKASLEFWGRSKPRSRCDNDLVTLIAGKNWIKKTLTRSLTYRLRDAAGRCVRRRADNKKRRGFAPPFVVSRSVCGSEQPQHRLVGLRRHRQRRRRELLAGLQGKKVRRFLVGIGKDEAVGAGLQRVDHRLGEVLT